MDGGVLLMTVWWFGQPQDLLLVWLLLSGFDKCLCHWTICTLPPGPSFCPLHLPDRTALVMGPRKVQVERKPYVGWVCKPSFLLRAPLLLPQTSTPLTHFYFSVPATQKNSLTPLLPHLRWLANAAAVCGAACIFGVPPAYSCFGALIFSLISWFHPFNCRLS